MESGKDLRHRPGNPSRYQAFRFNQRRLRRHYGPQAVFPRGPPVGTARCLLGFAVVDGQPGMDASFGCHACLQALRLVRQEALFYRVLRVALPSRNRGFLQAERESLRGCGSLHGRCRAAGAPGFGMEHQECRGQVPPEFLGVLQRRAGRTIPLRVRRGSGWARVRRLPLGSLLASGLQEPQAL